MKIPNYTFKTGKVTQEKACVSKDVPRHNTQRVCYVYSACNESLRADSYH